VKELDNNSNNKQSAEDKLQNKKQIMDEINGKLNSTLHLENSAADLKNKQQAEFDQHVADLVKKFGGSPKK